ncbi:MAG: methylmalonyl-CoA mutase, partial [Bacteroidetes bacterium]|nr:methylmalonyl-CoA mutase [Bacteroidota bacterium]
MPTVQPRTSVTSPTTETQSDWHTPVHPIRFVTAASLFDGHDAAIHIMRRVLQSAGAEVIHLGHNRSVGDIVDTAIQEDVQGIAISSYQGGHMEYFTYMIDLLRKRGAQHIRVYGGGGGVIVPEEIEALHAYGVARIFSPEDGLKLGLRGMIDLMMRECDFDVADLDLPSSAENVQLVARSISRVETGRAADESPSDNDASIPVIGITGTGGAGKSTLTDELVRRFVTDFHDLDIAVLSVDPTRRSTGGALLGDRIRMNSIYDEAGKRVYMRSLATRQA